MDTLNARPTGYSTLKELAQVTGVTFRTVQRWLAEGKIVGVFDSHANKWLISEVEFERVKTQGVVDARRKKQSL